MNLLLPHASAVRRHLSRRFFLGGVLLLALSPALLSAAEHADKVVVKKGARKMMLMRDGEVIRTYKISLGSNPVGHKQEQGDSRTPEGNYVLDYRNRHSRFYKSIHISYPNAKDRARARKRGVNPGGMIMIHGSPNDVKSGLAEALMKGTDWTDGCIAVSNREMDEIWKLVRDGTPIQIDP